MPQFNLKPKLCDMLKKEVLEHWELGAGRPDEITPRHDGALQEHIHGVLAEGAGALIEVILRDAEIEICAYCETPTIAVKLWGEWYEDSTIEVDVEAVIDDLLRRLRDDEGPHSDEHFKPLAEKFEAISGKLIEAANILRACA